MINERYLNKANSLLGRLYEDDEFETPEPEEVQSSHDNSEPNDSAEMEAVNDALIASFSELIDVHGANDVIAAIINALGDSNNASDVKLGQIIQNAVGPLPE